MKCEAAPHGHFHAAPGWYPVPGSRIYGDAVRRHPAARMQRHGGPAIIGPMRPDPWAGPGGWGLRPLDRRRSEPCHDCRRRPPSPLRIARASERPDRPGPARRRLPGLDPRQGPEPGRPTRGPGRPRRRREAAGLEALAAVHVKSTAATSRRAWPPCPPTDPTAPAWRRWASPRSRRRSPGSHGTTTAMPPRPTMTPTALRPCRSAGPPATASGSACSGLMRGAGWARCSSPSMPSCTARCAQADPREARRRPGQPPAVRRRGRDHRRAGTPRGRPGLRPGQRWRRTAVLRHAVRQG